LLAQPAARLGRRFQSPEFVKHFIDTMALHKLNVLHWHLTDDRWRIQPRPRNSPRSARARQPDEMRWWIRHRKYGSFYTQEQIRDIVRYAAERYHDRAGNRHARSRAGAVAAYRSSA
jgi:hexosaminidase